MIEYFFGTLTEARKKNWNNGEQNPYDVVVENVRVSDRFYYKSFFHDEIWIDWGTTAKKITGKELLSAMAGNGIANEKVLKGIVIKEDEEYGFVEMEAV